MRSDWGGTELDWMGNGVGLDGERGQTGWGTGSDWMGNGIGLEVQVLRGISSQGPQHVFWICLDQIVESNNISSQKKIGFMDELKCKWTFGYSWNVEGILEISRVC